MTNRKFWFSLITVGAVAGIGVLAGFFPAIGAVYTQIVAGILGAQAAYVVGNVATKHVTKGAVPAEPAEPAEPADPEASPEPPMGGKAE